MKNLIKNTGSYFFILCFILGNLLWGVFNSSNKKVAVVCFLEGKAWLIEQEGKESHELDLFEWIEAGTSIKTDQNSQVVLAFANGDRYELGEETFVAIGEEGFVSQDGTVKKLENAQVMPRIAEISRDSRPGSRLGGIRLRAPKREISGLYPNEGAAAIADDLALTFDPLEGVKKYRVEVEDEAGNDIFSKETAIPEVVMPKGIVKPGADYYWQVRILEEGMRSTVSFAAFSTISEQDALLRNAYRKCAFESKKGPDLLLLAQLEMSLELRREAKETLKKALTFYPDNENIKKIIKDEYK